MLKINEIFYSIQGEGNKTGFPCIFIRLTYCNLRCSYCDTEYAFHEGKEMTLEEVLSEIKIYDCNLVEITGGEPLVQSESIELMRILCDMGYEVLLETSGSMSISDVDKRVKTIIDFKCPSSNMELKNDYSNIDSLKSSDEIKFVIGDRNDYEWTKDLIRRYDLTQKCNVLLSTVFGKLDYESLAEWILEDSLKVRFQIQLHKHIWEPDRKGV